MTQTIRAHVRHIGDPKGVDLYEIDCEGFHLCCHYPVNRMAKLLTMAGIKGHMVVVNSLGKVRMRVDIATSGAKRLSETAEGIERKAWCGRSTKPLIAELVRHTEAGKAARKAHRRRRRGGVTKRGARGTAGNRVRREGSNAVQTKNELEPRSGEVAKVAKGTGK